MNSVWQVAVDPGVGMIAAVVRQSLWQFESTQAKAVCIAQDFAHAWMRAGEPPTVPPCPPLPPLPEVPPVPVVEPTVPRRYGASPRFWDLNAFATKLASMVAPARLVCVASLPSAWNFSAAAFDPSELYQAVESDVRST